MIQTLFSQINSCLKKGGWFCARTPHKFSYVAIGASILKNSLHTKLLKYVQPSRKEVDVFPTHYKMNTKKLFGRFSGTGAVEPSFIEMNRPTILERNLFI